MSTFHGKVRVNGTATIRGEKVFVLELIQARDSSHTGQPFFARFDEQASWFDDLRPAFGEDRFFFETDRADTDIVTKLPPSRESMPAEHLISISQS